MASALAHDRVTQAQGQDESGKGLTPSLTEHPAHRPAHLQLKAQPPTSEIQIFSEDFFFVEKEKEINRHFCGEKALLCTLGQLVKLQKTLPISSEVCLHNMQKGNKHWLS